MYSIDKGTRLSPEPRGICCCFGGPNPRLSIVNCQKCPSEGGKTHNRVSMFNDLRPLDHGGTGRLHAILHNKTAELDSWSLLSIKKLSLTEFNFKLKWLGSTYRTPYVDTTLTLFFLHVTSHRARGIFISVPYHSHLAASILQTILY